MNIRKWKLREWLGLFVGVVGVAISGISIYFGVLQQKDELRAVFSEGPGLLVYTDDDEQTSVRANSNGEVTLINAGNRTALVRRIMLQSTVRDSTEEARCEPTEPTERAGQLLGDHGGPDIETWDYKINPVALKPGELISIKLPRIEAIIFDTADDGNRKSKRKTQIDLFGFLGFSRLSKILPQGKKTISLCVGFDVVLPDTIKTDIFILTGAIYTLNSGEKVSIGSRPLLPKGSITLVSRTRTLFFN